MVNTNATGVGSSHLHSHGEGHVNSNVNAISINNGNIGVSTATTTANKNNSGINSAISRISNGTTNNNMNYAPSSGHGVAAAAALAGASIGVADDEAFLPLGKKEHKRLGGAMLWTDRGEESPGGGDALHNSAANHADAGRGGAALRQNIDGGFRGGEAGVGVGVGARVGLNDLNALQMYLSDSKVASSEDHHLGVS